MFGNPAALLARLHDRVPKKDSLGVCSLQVSAKQAGHVTQRIVPGAS